MTVVERILGRVEPFMLSSKGTRYPLQTGLRLAIATASASLSIGHLPGGLWVRGSIGNKLKRCRGDGFAAIPPMEKHY